MSTNLPFSKFNLFGAQVSRFNLFGSQVSSEEEQEKPGNFIQGKPRMSLVRSKIQIKLRFNILNETKI